MDGLEEIKRYILKNEYPSRLKNVHEKRNFRRLCVGYTVDSGALMKHDKRVLGDSELDDVLNSVHSQPHGGHLGINKTKIQQRYYHEGSTTQQSPFFLVYGREARLPIDVELPSTAGTQTDLTDRVNVFLELTRHRESAAKNIEIKQLKQKKHHDKNVKTSVFEVGDEVLLQNTRKLTRKGGKLDPLWTGPFIVERILNNGCYRLSGRLTAINGNRQKAYRRSETSDTANQPDNVANNQNQRDKTTHTASPRDKTPNPASQRDKTPDPASQRDKTPNPASQRDKTPDTAINGDKTPDTASQRDKIPDTASQRDKTPNTASPRDKTPNPASQRDKIPDTASQRDKTPNPASQRDKIPDTASQRDKTPNTAIPRDKTPNPASQRDKIPDTASQRDKTPNPASQRDKIPDTASQRDKTPDTASPREKTPNTASQRDKIPDTASPREKTPNTASQRDKTPNTASQRDKTPNTASQRDKAPDAARQRDKTPNTASQRDKTPDTARQRDKTPNTASQRDKIQDTASQRDKTPDTDSQRDKTPDTASQRDKTPNTASQRDKIPDTASQRDKTPNTASQRDKIPDTASQRDKIPDTASQRDKTPDTDSQRDKSPNTASQRDKIPDTASQRAKTPDTDSQRDKTPNTASQCDKIPDTASQRDKTPDTASQRDKTPNTARKQYKRKDQEMGIPLKKRKVCIDEDEDVVISHVETSSIISFDPVGHTWQNEKCQVLDIKVRNYHRQVQNRPVTITARPKNTAQMRGDGNCLFRTFSYLLSGVQSYHAEVRHSVVNYILTNSALFEGYTDETLSSYLNTTEMWKCGQWRTDIEILAFATMLNTNVFVYCKYGGQMCWTKFSPMNSTAECNVYLLHRNDHYEPVLDVTDIFSKPPYLPIGKYVPEQCKVYVSGAVLGAALVNDFCDERVLEESETPPDIFFVRAFNSSPNNIPGTERIAKLMDPNVFNLLCDEEDFANHWL